MEPKELHPSIKQLLSFFEHAHLPPHLSEVSAPFCDLADRVAHNLDGAEATVCLRKLLEAKDCAVRAKIAGGR